MLRRIELEVLATVDRGDTISELATKLDYSESFVASSEIVSPRSTVARTSSSMRRSTV